MKTLSSLQSRLQQLEKVSFRFRPKTDDVYEEAARIANEFLELSEAQKNAALDLVTMAASRKLISLSGLLAEYAVNSKDSDWIRIALALQVLEDFRYDYRENYRRLVLLSDAARRLEFNLSEAIKGLRSHMTERSTEWLEKFLERDRSLNELQAFGIRADVTDSRLRYLPAD